MSCPPLNACRWLREVIHKIDERHHTSVTDITVNMLAYQWIERDIRHELNDPDNLLHRNGCMEYQGVRVHLHLGWGSDDDYEYDSTRLLFEALPKETHLMSTQRTILRSVRCVGQFFLGKPRQEEVKALPVGTEVVIIHEQDNEHDKLAALCTVNGQPIGYIPKECSPTCVLFASSNYPVTATIVGFANKGQANPLLDVVVEMPE